MTKILLSFALSILALCSIAQESSEKVYQTFKDTRVINAHSTEMLRAGYMDFRIGHRFGDFGGPGGGWETFYGLENATDVMIGFEYGITDNLMIGINRAKGSGPLKQNVNGIAKIRLAEQDVNGSLPFSLAVLGQASISTMPKSPNEGQISFFAKFPHRMTYHAEAIIAGYFPPLGIGLEWETGGGHVFQLNLTNASGISQTDYIPYTQSSWLEGGYRLGFTIGRQFKI